MSAKKNASASPVFLFDLDGTLIDSVYQHVLAWREALETLGTELSNWKIHRRIGMSGGLIIHAFTRDTGRVLSPQQAEHLQKLHGEAYERRQGEIRLLPGAKQLLARLTAAEVKWAIATSGKRDKAQFSLDMLEVGDDVPVITRDEVEHAKPAPDLFLAAAQKVGVELADCVVVGDSVWDLLAARRARALGVGFLSGGYGEDELLKAGAYRVYADPLDLLQHLEEIGVRS
jgi:HAD superfamily hydrolase (TIGR01549 family)